MGQGLEERKRRRALAFVRALARRAPLDRSSVERAQALVGTDASVARAAALLTPGRLWALTAAGEGQLTRLRTAYGEALDFSCPALRAFSDLDSALADVDASLERSSRILTGEGDGPADLVTGDGQDVSARLALEHLSVLCYVVAALYGVGVLAPLAGIRLREGEGAAELEAVAARLAERAAATDPLGCWTIMRYPEGGVVMPAAEGFVLDWFPLPLDALDSAHDLRRVAPTLSVARGRGALVVMAGQGNVVGTDPLDSVKLRGAGVASSLSPSALVGRPFDLARPVASLRAALGGDAFCLPPEELARALDRRSHLLAAGRLS